MEDLIEKLNDLKNSVLDIKSVLNIKKKKNRLEELNKKISKLDFWDNNLEAIETNQEAQYLKTEIDLFEDLESEIKNLKELANLSEECRDETVGENIRDKFNELESRFKEIEFLLLFSEDNLFMRELVGLMLKIGLKF